MCKLYDYEVRVNFNMKALECVGRIIRLLHSASYQIEIDLEWISKSMNSR